MKTAYQIIAAIVAGVVVACALMLIFPPKARAEGGVGDIELLFEPCRLTHMITNLPRRATWTEDGKVTEGCWGPNPGAPGVVTTFWEDKTVVPILTDKLRRKDERPKVGV